MLTHPNPSWTHQARCSLDKASMSCSPQRTSTSRTPRTPMRFYSQDLSRQAHVPPQLSVHLRPSTLSGRSQSMATTTRVAGYLFMLATRSRSKLMVLIQVRLNSHPFLHTEPHRAWLILEKSSSSPSRRALQQRTLTNSRIHRVAGCSANL